KKNAQIMRFLNRQAALRQGPFQQFLDGLLTVKADFIGQQRAECEQMACDEEIVFGLAQPLPGQPLHRALFRASQCPEENYRRSAARLPGPEASERSGRGEMPGLRSPHRCARLAPADCEFASLPANRRRCPAWERRLRRSRTG